MGSCVFSMFRWLSLLANLRHWIIKNWLKCCCIKHLDTFFVFCLFFKGDIFILLPFVFYNILFKRAIFTRTYLGISLPKAFSKLQLEEWNYTTFHGILFFFFFLNEKAWRSDIGVQGEECFRRHSRPVQTVCWLRKWSWWCLCLHAVVNFLSEAFWHLLWSFHCPLG